MNMADTQDTNKQQPGQSGQHQSGNPSDKTRQPQQENTHDDANKKNQGGQDEKMDQSGQRRAS
jgi:hypothetical protein